MINKYPGTCYRCGEPVAAGQGRLTFENLPYLRWPGTRGPMTLLEHPSCAIKFRGTDTHYLHQPIEDNGLMLIDTEDRF